MYYKIVGFDLDGTLITGIEYIWQHIHDFLNTDMSERDRMKKKFFNHEISYADWAEHDIMLWKQAGATKSILLNAIGQLRLVTGARETIGSLKEQGIRVGVISGSIDFVLEQLFPDHPFDFIYMNKLLFKSDGTIDRIIPTEFDFEYKASALEIEAKETGVELSRCVFVGDQSNDYAIAKSAGLAIGFNCRSKKLKEVVDLVITEPDLRNILPHIT